MDHRGWEWLPGPEQWQEFARRGESWIAGVRGRPQKRELLG